jgi:hypothetical protein
VAVCLGFRVQQWEALEVDQVGGTARGRVHRLGKLLPGRMRAAVRPRLRTPSGRPPRGRRTRRSTRVTDTSRLGAPERGGWRSQDILVVERQLTGYGNRRIVRLDRSRFGHQPGANRGSHSEPHSSCEPAWFSQAMDQPRFYESAQLRLARLRSPPRKMQAIAAVRMRDVVPPSTSLVPGRTAGWASGACGYAARPVIAPWPLNSSSEWCWQRDEPALQNRFLGFRLAAIDLAGNQVRLCQPHWALTTDPHHNLHLAFFVR